jgi:TP901 family phage tail tape measure protein
MGLAQDETGRFEEAMLGVFANNFGESFDDIGQALVTVSQSLDDMPVEELQGITEDAFALRDAFDMDVTESVTGAKALMEAFALTGEQSMDLIANGMQTGLNASGDFVESLGEYSNLFAEAGFSADQMYNIMRSGAQAGILGTDKIADAIKEMGIKLNEGTDETKAAFDTIGLSFDDIAASIAAGDETWADYFDNIVGGLNDIEDPMERASAQTAIFGTMAEDLGVSFTEGLSSAGVALEDMSEATEALNAQYDNWPSMWEGVKRNALLALKPLGDALLDIGNRIMPIIEGGFVWLQNNVAPIIETIAGVINAFIGNLEEGMSPLDAFIESLWDIAPQWLLDALVTLRDDILPALFSAFTLLGDYLSGVWSGITAAFDAFLKLFDGDFEGFGEGLKKAWGILWATITGFLSGIWGWVEPHLSAFWISITEWFGEQEWLEMGQDAIAFVSDGLAELWDLIEPKLEEFWTSVTEWFGEQEWLEMGQDAADFVKDGLSALWEKAEPILDEFLKSAEQWFGKQDWEGMGALVITGISAGLKTFENVITPQIEKWVPEFTEKWNGL